MRMKSPLIKFVFAVFLLLSVHEKARGDCPACFNMVEVDVELLSGRKIHGYAYEYAYESRGLLSQKSITIVDNYYGIESLLLDRQKIDDTYLKAFYYNENTSVAVAKKDIKNIKQHDNAKGFRGSFVGLPEEFLNKILSQQPLYSNKVNGCIFFSYDNTISEMKFIEEKKKCYNLADESTCINNILKSSKHVLYYCEDLD